MSDKDFIINGRRVPHWERRRMVADEVKKALVKKCSVCERTSAQSAAAIGEDGVCARCRNSGAHEKKVELEKKVKKTYDQWGEF